MPRISRRRFLGNTALIATTLPLPAWVRAGQTSHADSARNMFGLNIAATPIQLAGRAAQAIGINGSVPGPLLRFREGQPVTINVRNSLAVDSSLHWHGLILPTGMDGVPGISFDGIGAGQTFRYHFNVRQNGTYWYHSHSGLQEQSGVYGPIIIDPAGTDPVEYDRDFVILLSDWTFEHPHHVLANLKKADDHYVARRPTVNGELPDRSMWSKMRMSPTDIADVSGLAYTFLLNGLDAGANWTGVFSAGEKVRLRVINGSAMTFFNVRIPELDMTVVQADGQNIAPQVTDELQIGVAETYDIVVSPRDRAYTFMAEATDRSGFVRGTLAPRAGMSAEVPPLREPPLLTMEDMGMDHGDRAGHSGHQMPPVTHDHRRGPGVDGVVEMPRSRLDNPGTGLTGVGHRTLRYSDLRSLAANTDRRKPGRQLEIHLTDNMHRYMWSFDGFKFSEVSGPIQFRHGERLRLVLVNDTMMPHPIHLHGMFMELVNGNGLFNPRKHTVVVKPAERMQLDITADAPGRWAFHCHLLYHMHAGMMQSVLVSDESVVT